MCAPLFGFQPPTLSVRAVERDGRGRVAERVLQLPVRAHEQGHDHVVPAPALHDARLVDFAADGRVRLSRGQARHVRDALELAQLLFKLGQRRFPRRALGVRVRRVLHHHGVADAQRAVGKLREDVFQVQHLAVAGAHARDALAVANHVHRAHARQNR